MPSANIQRRAIHFGAAAQSARLSFLFQNDEGILTLVQESMGEAKAGRTCAQDDILNLRHLLTNKRMALPAKACPANIPPFIAKRPLQSESVLLGSAAALP